MPIETFYIKLVSKVFAQKEGGEVMTATSICSDFGGFRCRPPLRGTVVYTPDLFCSHVCKFLIMCYTSLTAKYIQFELFSNAYFAQSL